MSDAHDHEPQSFISRDGFSFDPKTIGKQYLILARTMAGGGGLLAMLIRPQLGWPGTQWPILGSIMPTGMASGVMTPEFYVSLFTMHGTIMVFFVLSLAPVSGFGNLLIPMQIGARDMAFPFLNMLSFWTVVPGAILIIASVFVPGGAAAAGWTAYPPLSAVQSAIPGSQMGQTLWIIGMVFFIAAFTMGGLNFVVTILNLRTKGLSMMRLPLTTWAQFVVGILGLLPCPARGRGPPLLRSPCRHHFFPSQWRLCSRPVVPQPGRHAAALAASFLVPGPSRGLHHHAARHGILFGYSGNLFSASHFRLPLDGICHPRHRHPELSGMGASHVHKRHEPLSGQRVRHDYLGHRYPLRRQSLQLAVNALGGENPLHHSDVVRPGDRFPVRDRGADRNLPRHQRRRYSAPRYVLRGGSFPFHHGRRGAIRCPGC